MRVLARVVRISKNRYHVRMKLMRETRCSSTRPASAARPVNTWAGDPTADRFEQFWTLQAVVEGAADPQTGYVCDVRELDVMLRDVVAPLLREYCGSADDLGAVAPALCRAFEAAVGACPVAATLCSITFVVSPFTRFEVHVKDGAMVRLTRSFEFSAAHRLYCDRLSDEENRRLFGKCSNPHGHGHNYVVEVTVCGTIDGARGTVVDLPAFDRAVQESVILPFDHKNLNIECPEFAELNPSVENIARVIFQRLVRVIERGELLNIRVWETPKTYADYGPNDASAG